jgi:phage terminase small subunit
MPTEKQKRVVAKIMENNGNVSKSMREVGYSKNFSKNPQTLLESDGFKEAAFDYLKELEEQKKMTIKRLKEEMPEAKFGELSQHLDRVTKNIELLEGRNTENSGITIKTIHYGGDDSAQV